MTRYRPPHGGLVAVAGKGGTGKTTFSSLLIRYLVEQGETPVLAVDADPNANLGELLGLRPSVSVGCCARRVSPVKPRCAIFPRLGQTDLDEYRMHQAVAEGPGLMCWRWDGPRARLLLLRQQPAAGAREHAGRLVPVGGHGQRGRFEHLNRHVCRRADVMFLLPILHRGDCAPPSASAS